jgi:Icc protein
LHAVRRTCSVVSISDARSFALTYNGVLLELRTWQPGGNVMNAELHILHLTDFHLCADRDRRVGGEAPYENASRVLAAIHDSPDIDADLALLGGDIAHDGRAETYGIARRLLGSLSCSIFAVPGNHDDVTLLKSSFPMDESHAELQFSRVGWGIYLIDSTVEGQEHGFVPEGEVDRVIDRMERSGLGHHLVVLHHDVVQNVPPARPGLVNAPDVVQRLLRSRQNVVLLTGHRHMEIAATLGSVTFLGTPSTCFQFRSRADGVEPDPGTRPGYRRLVLGSGGSFLTSVVWAAE